MLLLLLKTMFFLYIIRSDSRILKLLCIWEIMIIIVVVFLQVQIRPWNLSDADFVMDGSQPLDPRKTIFVGGVPRPLRAGMYIHLPGDSIVEVQGFFPDFITPRS